MRPLFTLTYEYDALLCHRAIEGIGDIAALTAASDLERLRDFIRGLFWLMCEESGGTGRHSAEAIAEICLRVPPLREDYAKLLPHSSCIGTGA